MALPITAIVLSMPIIAVTVIASRSRVTIKTGVIEGVRQVHDGKTLTIFLGIPYAEPPVGDLRFKKPKPAARWTGVKKAKEFGFACMQGSLLGYTHEMISEDCLTLNVFVPGKMQKKNKKAVMVWIHGGAYYTGGTSLFRFNEFSARGDVIVVSINYRVGVFGFLSTGDVNAPGNAGLWDQIEGLKWVRDNIKRFGGDPNRVTIFGESAGASSVSQLALTTAARGLFHRFITMSGTALSTWSWASVAPAVGREIGDWLGCSGVDTGPLLACLRDADAKVLLNASLQVAMKQMPLDIVYAPVVDGDMFPEAVSQTLLDPDSDASQHLKSLDYMGGFLCGDGGVFYLFLPFDITDGIEPSYFCDVAIPLTARSLSTSTSKQEEIARKLKDVYCDPTANAVETGHMYGDFMSDIHFAVPTIQLISAHQSPVGGDAYLYYFTEDPSFGHYIPTPHWFQGANHGDDVPFILGPSTASSYNATGTFNDHEKELSYAMMTYWTNFAKTGNPNYPSAVPSKWESYTDAGKEYMALGKNITPTNNVNPIRMDLWLRIIPEIIGAP